MKITMAPHNTACVQDRQRFFHFQYSKLKLPVLECLRCFGGATIFSSFQCNNWKRSVENRVRKEPEEAGFMTMSSIISKQFQQYKIIKPIFHPGQTFMSTTPELCAVRARLRKHRVSITQFRVYQTFVDSCRLAFIVFPIVESNDTIIEPSHNSLQFQVFIFRILAYTAMLSISYYVRVENQLLAFPGKKRKNYHCYGNTIRIKQYFVHKCNNF